MSRPVASVTGASGGIGSRLSRALLETHEVRGLFRAESDQSRAFAAAGGVVVLGALDQPQALAQLITGADVVFHCAAMVTGFSGPAFFKVNVDGAQAVARTAREQRCRRLVHVSSIAAYGTVTPRADGFSEALELRDDETLDAYSRSKLLGEVAVKRELASGPTELTIVRPTCVYGPGIASWTTVPLDLLRKGRRFIFGLDDGEGRLNVIYVDDLVAGIVDAARHPGAAGKIFNLGHEEVSFREFYSYLGAMVGRTPAFSAEKSVRKLGDRARAMSRVIKPAAELSRGIAMAIRMSRNTAAYPSAAAAAAFGFAPRTRLPEGMLATELWLRGGKLPREHPALWNCDRHYAIRPAAIVRPRDESELAAAVRLARRAGRSLKAIGSLHTFAPVPTTDGVVVSLERMNRVLAVDGTLVTAEAGITIEALNRELAQRGLALPTHGSFVAQTLAGAIATSTHGGSLRHGTLSDYVEQIDLVTADGEARTLRVGDAAFGGAVVSLGLLGVTARIAVRCVPEFFLRAEPTVMPFEEFLRDFHALQRDNEFVDARYFPQIGQVEVLRMNRVARPENFEPPIPARPTTAFQRKTVSNVFKALLRVIAASGSAKANAAFVRKLLGATYRARVGRSDEVLAFTDLSQGEPFPIDDLEFAVPYASAVEALRALDAHFRGGGRMPVFFPIHLRCSRGGEQWLSANHGQDVCWLELWHYPARPAFYAEIESVLARFAPRFHLGKILPRSAAASPVLNLPLLAEFRALRQKMDPEGVFLNDYPARVLGIAR